MCIVGNPIILHCQIISFLPKKEKENEIMEFLNLFIYIYIQKIHFGWGLFHESNKGFPKLWNSTFFSPKKKKKVVKLVPYGQTRLTGNRSPKRFF